jgi:hypothetical protein
VASEADGRRSNNRGVSCVPGDPDNAQSLLARDCPVSRHKKEEMSYVGRGWRRCRWNGIRREESMRLSKERLMEQGVARALGHPKGQHVEHARETSVGDDRCLGWSQGPNRV